MDNLLNFNQQIKKYQYRKIFVIILILCLFSGHGYSEDSLFHDIKNNTLSDGIIIYQFPAIIEHPGVYYLNSSFICNESPIIIQSSDVCLNGFGYSIDGNITLGSVGLSITSPSQKLENITIKNASIQGFDIGMQIENSTHVYIESTDLLSHARAGLNIKSSSDVHFIDGEIKNNRNEINGGYGVQISESDFIYLENSIITGNGKTKKSNSGGIFIADLDNSTIQGCHITSNPGFGIKAEYGCDSLSILDNKIMSNSGDGISLENSSNPIISNCVIDKSKGSGIKITDVVHPSLINNRVSSGTMGMSISKTLDMIFTDNKISNNRIGFDISGSKIEHLIHQISSTNTIDSRNLLYLNNVHNRSIGLRENPATILAVNCADLSLSDLILSKNGAGISLAGCMNVSLSDLTFLENGIGLRSEYGAYNISGSDLHAERNLVSGYYLSSTHNFTLQSVFAQESPSGILILNSTNGVLKKVFIDKITGINGKKPSGLTISGSNNLSVNESLFSECSYAGLISDSHNMSLINNVFRQNTYAGAIILSGPVTIHKNSFIKNNESGLILRTVDSEIIDNTFTENQKRGLLLIQGNHNTLIGNVFKNLHNCELSGTNIENVWNMSSIAKVQSQSNGGNYWGNMEGKGYSDLCVHDTSGICQDPYILDPHNIDYKPLSVEGTLHLLFMNADMNHNGKEDLQDVVVYMDTIISGNTTALYDFSGDGRINLNDVVAIFHHIIQK